MKKNIFYAVCSLSLLLFISSCAQKPDQKLFGKWREASGREGIEFVKNNTFVGIFIWDLTKQPLEVRGAYSLSGEILTLKPQTPKDLVPMTCKIKFGQSDDELILTFDQGGALKLDGSTLTYRRVK
jgi:hypothetical protein